MRTSSGAEPRRQHPPTKVHRPAQASGAPAIPNTPRNKQLSLLQRPAGSWLSPGPAHQWLQHVGCCDQATPQSTTQDGSFTAAHYQVGTAALLLLAACMCVVPIMADSHCVSRKPPQTLSPQNWDYTCLNSSRLHQARLDSCYRSQQPFSEYNTICSQTAQQQLVSPVHESPAAHWSCQQQQWPTSSKKRRRPRKRTPSVPERTVSWLRAGPATEGPRTLLLQSAGSSIALAFPSQAEVFSGLPHTLVTDRRQPGPSAVVQQGTR